jgi:hypothetical protein
MYRGLSSTLDVSCSRKSFGMFKASFAGTTKRDCIFERNAKDWLSLLKGLVVAAIALVVVALLSTEPNLSSQNTPNCCAAKL